MTEEANPPSEMRKVVVPSKQQAEQAVTQPQNLQLVPAGPEGTLVEKTEIRIEAGTPKGTMVAEAQLDVVYAVEIALISILMQNLTIATALTSEDIPATYLLQKLCSY